MDNKSKIIKGVYIENLMGSLDSRKVMVYLDMEEMNG